MYKIPVFLCIRALLCIENPRFSLHIVLIFATLAQLPTYNNKLTTTGLFLLFYNLQIKLCDYV